MKREFRWFDYITININWFALTARSQVLTPLVIPLLVQHFVGDAQKGTYVGIIRLWALMAALLFQALMGIFSDRSTLKFGRRRPFIFIGTLMEVCVFVLIGLAAGMEGMTGFWVLFVLYIFSMFSSNTSHAATQALIPDLVPDEKKGIFSGIKALLELPLPLVFVSFLIGKMIAAGNLWGALITLGVSMLITMGITMAVPEVPLENEKEPIDWAPIIRLFGMTAVFTATILGTGWLVRQVTHLSAGWASGRMLIVGIAGLLGMAVAVLVGVLLSLRAGLGSEYSDNQSYVWWVVNRLAFLVGGTNLSTFMIFFLQEKFPELAGEKAAGPAAQIIMFVGIFIILTAVPSGALADRYGKKLLVGISAVIGSLGAFIVVLAPNLTVIIVGGCFAGAALGFFYASNWALGTALVPKEKAGHFMGMQNLAGAGAGAIGAYIGGPIADETSYVLLMGIYAAIILLSLIPLRMIKVD